MTITKTMIENLVMLLDKHGLIHGAGNTPAMFCIQQAVNRVIHDDLYGIRSDSPGMDCLDTEIRSFGIRMNDCLRNMDPKERALALKRFAIAELGSNKINVGLFNTRMKERINIGVGEVDDCLYREDLGPTHFERLKKLADTAADVLKELGTEGSQFLYLVDEPDKKTQIKEACRLGNEMYAAQMADFGTTSCVVKPKPHKH